MSPDETISRAETVFAGGDPWGAESVLATLWADTTNAPPRVLHLLGAIRLQQRDFPQSEQFYRRAIEASPAEPRHHAALGELLFMARHHDHAIASYQEAMRLNPALPGIQVAYGKACFRAGRFAEAEKSARAILAAEPSPQAWDMLSSCLREQGNGKEALDAAEQGLKLEPNSVKCAHSRAAALASVGRDQEALEAFDALLPRLAGSPATSFYRAKALVNLKRYDEALRVVEEGLRRAPRDQRLVAAAAELRKRA
jgi:tetratricopeptide (TPR) repeat protein